MPVNRKIIPTVFSVIDRYLLREFAITLLGVIGVLWLIYIATRFARYLAQAAVGNLPSEVIFTLLGYSSLGALSLLLPIGAFLAVMLALGRMNTDNELTVMAACGIPRLQVMRNVGLFSGVVALVVGLLSLVVVPDILSGRYELEQKAKIAADTTGLVAGSFKESRDGSWTFYSQGLTNDKQKMENVFIEIHKGQRPLVFRAEQGRFDIDQTTGNKYLILDNGYRYEGQAGDKDYVIAEFSSHSLLIEKGGEKQTRERHKSLPTSQLWERGQNKDLAEIQWRVASPIMAVVLCFFAMVFAYAGPRKGRYAGLLPAILIYIVYSNLLGVTRAWIAKGVLPLWFGSLWVHLLMIMVLVLLFNQQKLRHAWIQRQRQRVSI
ncbi:MAG: LPS export ABC transporter permease LptF [Piscirickettsiaceae bacterium]|jgi:lipopolysaccharide export system permease protein|nr:LPS export ABC transporter permease LptF [Piscirickettsiaceae bacterium]